MHDVLPLTYMPMHTDTAMLLGGGNTFTGYEGAKFTSSPWLPLPHLHGDLGFLTGRPRAANARQSSGC